MLGVELEHALGLGSRCSLGHHGHDALHLERHLALAGQYGGGVAQACAYLHGAHLVAQSFLHGAQQGLVVVAGLLGGLLLLIGCQVEVGAGHVGELNIAGLLAFGLIGGKNLRHMIGVHGLQHEFVDILRAQQHVEAARQRRLHHRQLLEALARVAGGVVDLVLTIGHAVHILAESDHLVLAGAPEEHEVAELRGLHAVACIDAKLQAAAEVLEELLVALAVLGEHLAELGLHLALNVLGDGLELGVLLQRLA